MRLKRIEMDRRCYDEDFDYEATFDCNRFEAMNLNAKGFNVLYKPVIVAENNEPVVTSYNYCDRPLARVIFNNPATILFINGKKYVSKAHEENFDEEKGLLMCLAKAQGISHLELKRMIKGAERPSKAVKKGGFVDKETIEKTIEHGSNIMWIPASTHDEMHSRDIGLEKYIDSKIKKALKKRGRPKKTKEGD